MTAIERCHQEQPSEVFNVERPNTLMLANCNKVLDDSQSTMSFYFNFSKEKNLPGTEDSDELDFSNPASINAFLKKIFG